MHFIFAITMDSANEQIRRTPCFVIDGQTNEGKSFVLVGNFDCVLRTETDAFARRNM